MRHWLFHTWSKWKTFDEGPISRYYFRIGRTAQTGWYKKQERTCDICGKVQLRTVETEVG